MLIVGIVDFGNSSWISELTPAVEMQVCPLFSGKYLGEIQYNTIQGKRGISSNDKEFGRVI